MNADPRDHSELLTALQHALNTLAAALREADLVAAGAAAEVLVAETAACSRAGVRLAPEIAAALRATLSSCEALTAEQAHRLRAELTAAANSGRARAAYR